MDLYSTYCKEIQYFEKLFECARDNRFWLNLRITDSTVMSLWITKVHNSLASCGGCDLLYHHLYFYGYVKKSESGKIKEIDMGYINGWNTMCKCQTKLDQYINNNQTKWIEITVPFNQHHKWYRYCINSQTTKYSLSLPTKDELLFIDKFE